MKTILELRRERESRTPIRKMINHLSHYYSGSVDTSIPSNLVEQVVDKLNIDWYNPHLKILDVKSNHATFSLIIIEKLLEHGHHIDHILDNMIYAIDGDKIQSMTSKQAFLYTFKRGGNIYHEDFLTYDFKMKFDLIVGNPPYQDSSNKAKNNKLWHKFVRKSLTMIDKDGLISMVTPSSIFNDSVGIGKWFKELFQKDWSLKVAKIHDQVKFFDVGVETCHWTILKIPNQSIVEFPRKNNPIVDSIINKIQSANYYLDLKDENPIIQKKDTEIGTHEVYYSGKNKTTTDKPLFNGGLKIVYPFSASYSSQFITDQPTCRFNKVLYIENVIQGENILSYTNSDLFKFYAKTYKKTAGFTPVVKNKNLLPKLDDTKRWTDEEIYNYFKLSNEEIQFIKNTIG